MKRWATEVEATALKLHPVQVQVYRALSYVVTFGTESNAALKADTKGMKLKRGSWNWWLSQAIDNWGSPCSSRFKNKESNWVKLLILLHTSCSPQLPSCFLVTGGCCFVRLQDTFSILHQPQAPAPHHQNLYVFMVPAPTDTHDNLLLRTQRAFRSQKFQISDLHFITKTQKGDHRDSVQWSWWGWSLLFHISFLFSIIKIFVALSVKMAETEWRLSEELLLFQW